MKIKTRLRLNTFISVGTVFLILIALAWSWRELSISDRDMGLVDNMRKVAFERILLRDEYILYQEERSGKQWRAKSEELQNLLSIAHSHFDQKEDKALLQSAQKDFDATFSGFLQLIEKHEGQDTGNDIKPSFSDAELRQISQIFLKAYSLTDNINRLHESAQTKAASVRDRGVFIVIIFFFGGIVTIAFNSIIIRKTLAKRITAIGKGVEILGTGNLEYLIPVEGDDELTALSLASNEMANKLKKSYTSIEDLQREVAERKKVEKLLQEQTFWLSETQRVGGIGSYSLDFRSNAWTSSNVLDDIFGINLDTEKTVESWNALVHPDEQEEMLKYFLQSVVAEKKSFNKEYKIIRKNDGKVRWLWGLGKLTFDDDGAPLKMTGVIQDITERKQLDIKLKESLDELQRSNKELEQFAYVASHDLQEPLRMVSSYTQLLAERYKDHLDDKANLFIHYAVDGAVRMQLLINDLLTFSRIGTKGKPLEPVDVAVVLGEAISNLKLNIEETNTVITNDKLPEVKADRAQLVQLFQNLIGNAVKFRGEAYPHVHITAKDDGEEWLFSVKDNGIGIDPQFTDKIFVIFQRLHTREEYPGSGIGLAICKKIVERHGGRIGFESEPGKGTTFYFTIHK